MKRVISLLLAVVLVAALPDLVFSQNGRFPIGFGINFGTYQSSLNALNNQLRMSGEKETIGRATTFGGNIKIGATDNVVVKLDANYWKSPTAIEKNASLGNGVTGKRETTIKLIPLTVSGLYYLPFRKFSFSPYAGGGGGLYFVTKEVKGTPTNPQIKAISANLGGTGYASHFQIGGELTFFDKIQLTAEYRYVFGEFIQQKRSYNAQGGAVVVEEPVSISGPQVMFALSYQIGKVRPAAVGVPTMVAPSVLAPTRVEEKKEVMTATEQRLEEIRRQRLQAEKELEELKKLLQEKEQK